MVKGEIVGSWFNSGYHGHFRSKSRNDFICEYRHLAKPQPPKAFIRKLRLPAKTHQFSKHDNRESFYNDALIFTEGLGKRRYESRSHGWKPELLAWNPRPDLGPGPAPPEFSQYKVTYRGGHKSQPLVQQLVQRPRTSFDDDQAPTTSYRYAHGRDNPNREHLIDAMRNQGLSTASRSVRPAKFQFCTSRESVATCMNWVSPHEGKKPMTFPPCPRTPPRSSIEPLRSLPQTTSAESKTMLAPSPPSQPKPAAASTQASEPQTLNCTDSAPQPAPPPPQPKEAFAEN